MVRDLLLGVTIRDTKLTSAPTKAVALSPDERSLLVGDGLGKLYQMTLPDAVVRHASWSR